MKYLMVLIAVAAFSAPSLASRSFNEIPTPSHRDTSSVSLPKVQSFAGDKAHDCKSGDSSHIQQQRADLLERQRQNGGKGAIGG